MVLRSASSFMRCYSVLPCSELKVPVLCVIVCTASFGAMKHCRALISGNSDKSFPSIPMSRAAGSSAARTACLHEYPCAARYKWMTSWPQVWRQAPEEDQAAAIGIVVACMEAAQDVSRLPFNCALSLITSAQLSPWLLSLHLMLKTCYLRCYSVSPNK